VLGIKFGEKHPEIKTRVRSWETRSTVPSSVRDVATALRPAVLDFRNPRGGGEPGSRVPEAQRIRSALKFLGTEAQLARTKSIMMFESCRSR